MTLVSTPAWSSRIAVVCRRAWAVTCLSARLGQPVVAVRVWMGGAVFDGVSAEALASAPGEDPWCVGGASFLFPITQRSDCFGGQRGDAVFSSLAAAEHVSAGAEVDIAHSEAGHLRDAQSGLDGDEQESVVAPPGPGVAIRRCEQSFAFLVVEITDKVTINALQRDCQHTGKAGGMFGMAKGRVTEQAVDPAESGGEIGYRSPLVVFMPEIPQPWIARPVVGG